MFFMAMVILYAYPANNSTNPATMSDLSAPECLSIATIYLCPPDFARLNAVHPVLATIFVCAPLASSIVTISVCPILAAKCRGVRFH